VTETLLGHGDALDKNGFKLQGTNILEKKAQTRLTNAEASLIETDVEGKQAEDNTIIEGGKAENELLNEVIGCPREGCSEIY